MDLYIFVEILSKYTYQKKPQLIKTDLKFNDLYSKEGNSCIFIMKIQMKFLN